MSTPFKLKGWSPFTQKTTKELLENEPVGTIKNWHDTGEDKVFRLLSNYKEALKEHEWYMAAKASGKYDTTTSESSDLPTYKEAWSGMTSKEQSAHGSYEGFVQAAEDWWATKNK